MAYDQAELHRKMEEDIESSKACIQELMSSDLTDEDGYPTDAALEIVRIWHWNNPREWFDFIHSIWAYTDYGWEEGESIDEISGKKGYCYYISTAGWSGNESIIKAMQENHMMWHLNWVQSRRGGHYIFQLKEIK